MIRACAKWVRRKLAEGKDVVLGAAWARVTTERFIHQFPGRCMICSYHRYGYQHGLVGDPKPPAHDCCEGET